MRGIKRFSALAAAVSLAMLLGGGMVSNVHAESDHDGGPRQFEHKDHAKHDRYGEHGKRHHKWEMFRGLNLTSAQKEQIKGIMKTHHKELIEGRIAVLQARQNLMTATAGTSFDQAAVQKAFGDLSASQEKMVILRAKIFSEVMPILTPDQQAVVSGRLAQHKLRMQKAVSKLESRLKAPIE